MNTRATFWVIVAVLAGLGGSAGAQESAGDEGADDAPTDEKRERPPPSTGKLPVEDPTIHQDRNDALEPSAEKSDDPKTDENDESADDPETDSEEIEEPTVSALPVEDPTLQEPGEPLLEEGDEDPSKEPSEAPSEPAPEETQDDWGQRVQVAYGYPGGLLVGVDDWFYLALSGLVQARYAVNYRTKPPTDFDTGEREKQVTQGFDVARARFHLGVGLTQFVTLYMRIGVVAGGNFSFQRAFIDLKWKYFRVRAGLFMNETIAESLINPNDHYFNDYSILENVYTPGSSKGIMFTYLRKRFSINLGYSDGLRTGFSEIRSSTRADFAVTLRSQYAWGERGLSGFNRLTARRGTPLGIRLGAAMHYQDGGRSQGTAPVKIALGTLDLSVRGNGWSALVSAVSGQDGRVDGATAAENFEVVNAGVSATGGYFVLEDLQVFAQYSFVGKPKIQGTPPPSVPGLPTTDPSAFHAFGAGFSFFVVPGHDNVKLSTDFQYFLGYEAGSTVPASPLNNIQPNDDGSQFFWRIQLSAAF